MNFIKYYIFTYNFLTDNTSDGRGLKWPRRRNTTRKVRTIRWVISPLPSSRRPARGMCLWKKARMTRWLPNRRTDRFPLTLDQKMGSRPIAERVAGEHGEERERPPSV